MGWIMSFIKMYFCNRVENRHNFILTVPFHDVALLVGPLHSAHLHGNGPLLIHAISRVTLLGSFMTVAMETGPLI